MCVGIHVTTHTLVWNNLSNQHCHNQDPCAVLLAVLVGVWYPRQQKLIGVALQESFDMLSGGGGGRFS